MLEQSLWWHLGRFRIGRSDARGGLVGVSPYPSYREGCLAVVNLGADADRTAEIYGQPAGPYHGESDTPPDCPERVDLQ